MITMIALAAAAAAPLVTPTDPSARFVGDGVAVQLNRDCNGLSLDEMKLFPDCATKLASGDVATSLAVAAYTLTMGKGRFADAEAVLARSLQAHDHPATHYLLGSLLAQPSSFRPDYPRAIKHLTVAAARGNSAAADLLALQIIAGKGAPRDMPKAIALLEQAAAHGWPNAGLTLGKLYLQGKYVPLDAVRGRAWLDATAAVGDEEPKRAAALAGMADKVNNLQLIPNADPAKVTVKRFGTFDNPQIPPSFGFDPAFEAVHDMPFDDAATLAMLQAQAKTMPTPYLYELARRLAPSQPEAALRAFLLARMRMNYDSRRCADPAAKEAVGAWDLLVVPDLGFLLDDGGAAMRAQAAAALAEEAALPADNQPWWVCRSGLGEYDAAMAGKAGPLRLQPEKQWPALRKEARAGLQRVAGN